jgi:succinoglycan biosynthesis transport protein ExoP
MDGIQPYSGPARVPALMVNAADPTLVKSPSDYLRSLRRRIWLVLAVGVPLSVLTAVMAVRQPNVYRAAVDITIDPPQYDPILSSLVSHEIGGRDPDFNAKYVPNRIALLKSKGLAEQVLLDPALAQAAGPGEDPAQDLVNKLSTRPILNSNRHQVALEGTDPARTAKLLYALLELFQHEAKRETEDKNFASRENAENSLKKMNTELARLNEKIYKVLADSKTIGPGGKSIIEERYLTQGSLLLHKKARLGEVQQQAWVSQMFPGVKNQPENPYSQRIGELELRRDQLIDNLQQIRRMVRNFNSDPSARRSMDRLKQVIESIERYKSASVEAPTVDPSEAFEAKMIAEIRADEETAKALLKELQDSMPEHQRYLDYLDERNQKIKRIAIMQEKLDNFETLSKSQSQKSPVWIPASVPEPAVPVRPNRPLNIAMGVIIGFGLGIALVCLLEHLDHSVKVPEHLTMGLTLPLFGVIPRIRRTAPVHRGGHLWTPGAPDSIEADAYRNLRASLIGSSAQHGAIVTLLVTSAKAGEGKSTTALNLAATCARAGERTLLLDVDLRRPSLAGVFRGEDDDENNLGLVDVLRGDLPWQRTVVRTDIPNLDFLPTGDTRNIPIEILGTIELRQLIIALSHHYDRVILDGPAVLGLPDCRMLGAFVDAALLVVRSGSHGLQPLKRAKSFLEQSNVVIAGAVFNGLCEDLENWSSYGPNTPYGYPEIGGEPRSTGRGAGLNSPSSETRAALPSASSARA